MDNTIKVNLQINAETERAKKQIETLQTSLQKVSQSNTININSGPVQQASEAAQKLQMHLSNAINVNTGKLDLSKFNASIKSSGTTLNQLTNQLVSIGPTGQQAFIQLAQAIANAEAPMFQINARLAAFGKTLVNTIKWQVASTLIHKVTGSLSGAVSHAEELNRALTSIGIVTGKSRLEMGSFAASARNAANALNTTTTEYSKAALIFYQQGLSAEEVAKRTETTIKLSQVTGQAVQDVSSQLTAIWNNFDNGTKSLEYYADVITALGAATAASSEEIANGLQKFASIADTIGMSYEYASSALATIVANTRQSEETVGTSLKTILGRMESLKLGDTLDDGTSLNKYSEALKTIGVNVKDSTGQLKDMDTILDQLGEKWQLLGRDTQVAVAQTVAGMRQYNNFIALMDNWDDMQKNVDIAKNATGTLQNQADIWANSWEAASKRVKQQKENLFESFLDDKTLINFENLLADFIKSIKNVIDSMGGIGKTILLIVGSLSNTLFPLIRNGITRLKANIGVLTGSALRSVQTIQTETNAKLNEMIQTSDIYSETTRTSLKLTSQLMTEKMLLTNASKKLTESQKAELQSKMAIREATYEELQASLKLQEALQEEIKLLEKKANAESTAVELASNKYTNKQTDQYRSAAVRNGMSKHDAKTYVDEDKELRTAQIIEDAERMSEEDINKEIRNAQSRQENARNALSKKSGALGGLRSKENSLQTKMAPLQNKDETSLTSEEKQQLKEYSQQLNECIEKEKELIAEQEKLQTKYNSTKDDVQYYKDVQKLQRSIAEKTNEIKDAEEKTAEAIERQKKAKADFGDQSKEYQNATKEVKQAQDQEARAKSVGQLQGFPQLPSIKNEQGETPPATEISASIYDGIKQKIAETIPGIEALNAAEKESNLTFQTTKETYVGLNEQLGQLNAVKDITTNLENNAAQSASNYNNALKQQQKISSQTNASRKERKQATENLNKAEKEYNRTIEASKKAMSNLAKDINMPKAAVEKLEAAFDSLKANGQEPVKGVTDAFVSFRSGAVSAEVVLKQLIDTMGKDLLNSGQITEQEFETLTTSAQKLGQEAEMTDHQVRQMAENPPKVDAPISGFEKVSNSLTGMASAGARVAMAFNALKSIGNVFSDKDATVGEKISTLLMSMSMIIPVITTAFGALNAVKTVKNAIDLKDMSLTAASIGAYKKKIAAETGETASTWTLVAAKIAQTIAEHGLAGPAIGAFIVATIAATIAIVAHTAKVNADTKSIKAQNEANVESAKTSGEVVNAWQEQSNEMDNLIAKYKELKQASSDYSETVKEIKEESKDLIKMYKETGEKLKLNKGDQADYDQYLRNLENAYAIGDIEGAEKIRNQIDNFINTRTSAMTKTGANSAMKMATEAIKKVQSFDSKNGKEMLGVGGGEKHASKILKEFLGKYYIEDSDGKGGYIDFNTNDPKEYQYILNQLSKARDEIVSWYSKNNKTWDSNDLIDEINEILDDEDVQKAFEEFNGSVENYDDANLMNAQVQTSQQGYDISNIQNYKDYEKYKEIYLKNLTNGLDPNSEEYKKAVDQANEFFEGLDITSKYEELDEKIKAFEDKGNFEGAEYLRQLAETGDFDIVLGMDLDTTMAPQQIDTAYETYQSKANKKKLKAEIEILTSIKNDIKTDGSTNWDAIETKFNDAHLVDEDGNPITFEDFLTSHNTDKNKMSATYGEDTLSTIDQWILQDTQRSNKYIVKRNKEIDDAQGEIKEAGLKSDNISRDAEVRNQENKATSLKEFLGFEPPQSFSDLSTLNKNQVQKLDEYNLSTSKLPSPLVGHAISSDIVIQQGYEPYQSFAEWVRNFDNAGNHPSWYTWWEILKYLEDNKDDIQIAHMGGNGYAYNPTNNVLEGDYLDRLQLAYTNSFAPLQDPANYGIKLNEHAQWDSDYKGTSHGLGYWSDKAETADETKKIETNTIPLQSDLSGVEAEKVFEIAPTINSYANKLKLSNDLFGDNNELIDENTELYRQLSFAIVQNADAIDTIADKYNDWDDILSNGNSSLEERISTFKEMRKSIGNLFGFRDEFTDSQMSQMFDNEWLSQNYSKIKLAASGDQSAINDIKVQALSNFSSTLSSNGSPINQENLQDFIEDLQSKFTGDNSDAGSTIDWDTVLDLWNTHFGKTGEGVIGLDGTSFNQLMSLLGYQVNGLDLDENGLVASFTNLLKLPDVSDMISVNNGSGKVSSGTYKKSNKKPVEEEIDRYHYTNKLIESSSTALKRLTDAKNKAWGKAHLDAMNAESAELENQVALQERLLNETKQYLAQDKSTLSAYGVAFDEYGNVSNYEEVFRREYAKYQATVNSSDARTKDAGATRWEKFQKALSNYEDSLSKYEDAVDKLQEAKDKVYTAQLEKIDYVMNFKIDINDEAIERLSKKMERLGNDAADTAEKMRLIGQQGDLSMEKMSVASEALDMTLIEFLRHREKTNDEIADWVNKLHSGELSGEDLYSLDLSQEEIEQLDKTMEQLSKFSDEMYGYLDSLYESLSNLFSYIDKKFTDYIDKIDRAAQVMSNYQSLVDIVGKDILKLDSAFMKRMSDVNVNISMNKTSAIQDQYSMERQALEEAQAELERLRATGNKDLIAKQEELVKTIEESVNSSLDNLYSTAAETMEKLKERWQSTIDDTIEKIKTDFTNGIDYDTFKSIYDYATEAQARYLPEYEKAYELNKLNRNLLKSIDEIDSPRAKQQLLELEKKINKAREEGNKLTKYDVENLQKEYDLKLAQIALEEARNAKDTVRLSKDASGNWSYIYTANEEATNTAQQSYEDKLFAMEQANEGQITELQNQLLSANESYASDLENLKEQSFASEAEYMEAVNRITQQYKERLDYIGTEVNKVFANNRNLQENDLKWYQNTYLATRTKVDQQIALSSQGLTTSFGQTLIGVQTGFSTFDAMQTQVTANIGNINLPSSYLGTLYQGYQEFYTSTNQVLNILGTSIQTFGMTWQSEANKMEMETYELRDEVHSFKEESSKDFSESQERVKEFNKVWISQIEPVISKIEGLKDMIEELKKTAQQEIKFDIGYEVSAKVKGTNEIIPADTLAMLLGATIGDDSSSSLSTTTSLQGTSQRTAERLATGGYTGEWGTSSGKLAILHEKELVLNKADTMNILKTVDLVRQLSSSLTAEALTGQYQHSAIMSQEFAALSSAIQQGLATTNNTENFEQSVTINAEFPDTTDSEAIKTAFTSLVNEAAQYAHRTSAQFNQTKF